VLRVVVVGKGKSMEGLKPTVVGKPPLLTAPDLVHGNLREANNRPTEADKKAQVLAYIDRKNGS
jgi:hypothetical protein